MNLFDNKKIIKRYRIIAFLFVLIGIYILVSAMKIMTVDKKQWIELSESLQKDSVVSLPTRGNILSCDGEVLASSLPKYKIFMDFNAGDPKTKDSVWYANVDTICKGLNEIFPERSVEEFKKDLSKGKEKNSMHWCIWPKRIDYNTYKDVKKLPVFCLSSNKGGFHFEEYNARSHPFQSLAGRTVGDMYPAKDSARFGLELSYDSILRGKTGLIMRKKVLDRYLDITTLPAEDGADLVTTIDVNIQDLAEKAVTDKLKEIGGTTGVAILMECKTGDVKAIVNMNRCADGEYREIKNNAVSDRLEPGSVFKTASIMVALDDGVVDTFYTVDTGCGIRDMYGRKMKDHNWHRGGYGTISLPRSLEVSSNIGVSVIIDRFYHKNPEKYVEGLRRIGIAEDLHLPIVGSSAPIIRMPEKDATGKHYKNWYATALPWMSIGYETQVPPISTVSFYNAIANGGKMMQPRFVTKAVKDGETIAEFPPVVLKEHICKDKTLKIMREILTHVVSQGLGKQAGSKLFKVAGKTGTAQISQGATGYTSGTTHYLLSFAGFFPADNPMYSCIVCLQKAGLPASGGGMAGPVFKKIAEGVMAKLLKQDAANAKDTANIMPRVKSGNMLLAVNSLATLGFNANVSWEATNNHHQPVWGTAKSTQKGITLSKNKSYRTNLMPDVIGMGARDAVYMLENRGVKVRLSGRGTVAAQSIPAGNTIAKGATCKLELN